jgi:hypothetical protein
MEFIKNWFRFGFKVAITIKKVEKMFDLLEKEEYNIFNNLDKG